MLSFVPERMHMQLYSIQCMYVLCMYVCMYVCHVSDRPNAHSFEENTIKMLRPKVRQLTPGLCLSTCLSETSAWICSFPSWAFPPEFGFGLPSDYITDASIPLFWFPEMFFCYSSGPIAKWVTCLSVNQSWNNLRLRFHGLAMFVHLDNQGTL